MAATTEFAALLAIDWADQQHVWKLYLPESASFEAGVLEHSPESIAAWAGGLKQRFGGRPIAVALEQKRGALVAMLREYAHLTIFPVHPASLASYRDSFAPSGDKSDNRDVDLLLDMLCKHRERLRPLAAESAETQLLALLSEQRRHQVDHKTQLTNQLTANLKLYFPQILGWFSEIDTPLVAEFLRRWPTLPQLQTARPATLRRFFYNHNSRDVQRIEQRITAISQALPATTNPAVIEACTRLTAPLLAQIAIVVRSVAALDQRIAELFAQHSDAFIFRSFDGAGAALAPRLLAALGTDRSRFADAQAIACFSGVAPLQKQSGKTCVVQFRRACPKFIRQTFHEWAGCSIHFSRWAAEHYRQQRDRGKGHHAAIRSLALKWIRILYACWANRTPYDSDRYEAALARKHTAKAAPSFVWKTSAGFSQPAPFSS